MANNIENNLNNCSDGGLVLYYHSNSFYSQKVLFVLYEKNIKFTTYEVDVTNGEQYSKWFLELNPKGEIPVLKNGSLIIPESGRIISYLEDHFIGEHIPKLYPRDVSAHHLEKLIFFYRRISRIPIGAISMGSFIHSDLCTNPKPPFIGIIRNSFLKTDEKVSTILEEYAKINPAHADVLLRKAKFQERKRAVIADRTEYMNLIDVLDFVLAQVETELSNHDPDNLWLCCNQLTIADVSLAMLLHRLYCLGLENFFWKTKRPYIDEYFQRIQQLESFQKSLPTTFTTYKTIWTKTPPLYKVGAAALSATLLLSSIMAKH